MYNILTAPQKDTFLYKYIYVFQVHPFLFSSFYTVEGFLGDSCIFFVVELQMNMLLFSGWLDVYCVYSSHIPVYTSSYSMLKIRRCIYKYFIKYTRVCACVYLLYRYMSWLLFYLHVSVYDLWSRCGLIWSRNAAKYVPLSL